MASKPSTDRGQDVKHSKTSGAKDRLEKVDSMIQSCASFVSSHLQSVDEEVKTSFEGRIQTVKDNEREQIRLINEEADREIREINEKREQRIKECKLAAEQEERSIKETQQKLMENSKTIIGTVSKKIESLKSRNQHQIARMDDKGLDDEAPPVIGSVDEGLGIDEDDDDVFTCLEEIQREVKRVKYTEGKAGGRRFSRIDHVDGYIGEWKLIKSIDIPSYITCPLIRGLISDNEVCIWDIRSKDLYVANIISGEAEKVIDSHCTLYFTSCIPLDSEVIACGKWVKQCRGENLGGCITLYDRQWKEIRNICIPKNNRDVHAAVHFDVNAEGMIVAAQRGQSQIYTLDPADGTIQKSITMEGKVGLGLQVLSSGDIVVQTGLNEFTVVSQDSGKIQNSIQSQEWDVSRCHVDKHTDTLFITSLDRFHDKYHVDQVSPDGHIQARRIVEYADSDRSCYENTCVLTSSGNMVACDRGRLLVFSNSFIV